MQRVAGDANEAYFAFLAQDIHRRQGLVNEHIHVRKLDIVNLRGRRRLNQNIKRKRTFQMIRKVHIWNQKIYPHLK